MSGDESPGQQPCARIRGHLQHRAGQKRQLHHDAGHDPAVAEPRWLSGPRGAVVMPRHPEYLLPGRLNKVSSTAIVSAAPGGSSRATIRSVRANPSASPDQRALLNNLCARLCCHTRSRPALVSIPHRSAAGLRDQTDNQPDESTEGRSGRARPEHGQETGQRARYGGAGKHRRITITRVVQLARVDALLDDPGVLRPVQAVLRPRLGRPSTPMEVYLRLMFLKFRYRLGYETLSAVRDFGRALVCWPGLVALAGSIEPCYRAHGRHRPVAPRHPRHTHVGEGGHAPRPDPYGWPSLGSHWRCLAARPRSIFLRLQTFPPS